MTRDREPARPALAVAARAGGDGARGRRGGAASPAASSGFAGGAAPTTRRGRAPCSSPPASRSCVLPLVSPLDVLGDRYLLSAHMLQHMLIGDAGPALILLALRGPLLFFVDPGRLLAAAGTRPRLRAARRPGSRGRVSRSPSGRSRSACWHIPAAYDYAAAHPAVHDLEHASFVVAGFLRLDAAHRPGAHRPSQPRPPARRRSPPSSPLGTVIADVLIFSLTPLYPAYRDQPHRVFGLSPLHDQQLAGLVMTVEQISRSAPAPPCSSCRSCGAAGDAAPRRRRQPA